MPKSHDFIEEIVRRRGEFQDSLRFHFASSELRRLQSILEAGGDIAPELLQLVPVRIVACMEGCLKAAAAQLINHGDPYLQRARSLSGQIKLDFDLLTSLLGQRITVGEMVVHSLKWQSLATINATMSTLLDGDFFPSLRTARDRWHMDEFEKPMVIVKDLDRVLSKLAETIRIRQILCHEVASFFELQREQALEMLECGWQFTHATSWLVSETLYPNAPLTQADRTEAAWRRAEEADSELAAVLKEFMDKLDEEDRALLSESQDAWTEYREKFAKFEGHAAKGGTLSPQLRGAAFAALTRARISELTNSLQFKSWEAPEKR
jgi:uncharacterized protein YecT (DUF1311 family)